ncbi:hypothetical protein SADUNF_Sadunf11G0058300 [Salix dunnii]|uniref:Uncharacterized protein n=1 Tax=Salix dunnii TaxID=1413687 RepID=A0A835MWY1_9ROSI|nr:hypothetical protein SADUNF_Sadunf11G0058300 [Salix dunnii]
MLLFVNGTSHVYSGEFSGEDIVIWARKKTSVLVIRISSSVEAEDFQMKNHLFVLGLFHKFEGHDYEEFIKSTTTDNEIQSGAHAGNFDFDSSSSIC